MKKILIVTSLLVVAAFAYYLISPAFIQITADEDIFTQEEQVMISKLIKEPNNPELRDDSLAILKMGEFKPHDHEVEGSAAVIEREGGNILRFQDFHTINGPKLHIWLAKDLDGKEHIDLGAIKATTGNANYELPENIDLNEYRHVLVWCVPFKVLFSYAQLQ